MRPPHFGHLDHDRLGKAALWIPRAGQKTAEAPRLDDKVPSADLTDLVGDLVGDLDAHAVQRLLRAVQFLVKAAVKLVDDVLPLP